MDTLGAMEKVPREAFVPDSVKDQAWDDRALPIACGQTISQPLVVAMMTQVLRLSDRDTVLEIGTGCGYQTAVLSKMCRRVYTIERHKPLAEEAARRFDELRIRNVTSVCADGMKGWPLPLQGERAAFDKIIVTAAARGGPPHALKDQLKIGGMMIMPVDESGEQTLYLYSKESEDVFARKAVMPVRFVPLLPDIA
jgi:protein-L-isoaspartate(D-aspartate) O-methyltransferase